MNDKKNTLISNTRWVSLSQFTRVGVQLLSLLVFARLLSPQDYGVMALATIVTNFAYIFRDMGTSAAIIQRKDLSTAMINAVFWFNMVLGMSIAAIIIIVAPIMANIYEKPQLLLVLLFLAPVFPMVSSTATLQALMERDSRFAVVAKTEIFSVITGLIVGVALALSGAGVYSLVAQWLTYVSMATANYWLRTNWYPQRQIIWSELRKIVSFSSNLTVFGLLDYLTRNVDTMIIGKYLGAATLGVYNLALKLILFPMESFSYVALRSVYPVMSRCQDDLQQLTGIYLNTIKMISLISAPLMAGLFILREPFSLYVLGEKWLAIAPLLFWLAPVGFLLSVKSLSANVFKTLNQTGYISKIALLASILHICGFLIAIRWGIEAFTISYFLVTAITTIPALYFALKLLKSNWLALLHHLLLALSASASMMLALYAGRFYFPITQLSHFLLHILVGIVVYVVFIAVFDRSVLQLAFKFFHRRAR